MVAVPVNYGMLSYLIACIHDEIVAGRSPRQLWNALLRCICNRTIRNDCRSPRQLWNALLH